jgi:hypothetical protein
LKDPRPPEKVVGISEKCRIFPSIIAKGIID